jgi:ribosome-binding ATPase YchF (GTP1/OBG family)
MPLQVGIVGLPNAGKTTLFNALTHAGAEITAYATVADKPNVGMAPIADERLGRVAEIEGSAKVTPAAVRVLDVPGAGRKLLGGLREADALLAVLNGWAPEADPRRDLETIELELLLADREHVERRLERVEKEAKSGDPALRKEADALRALLDHLDAGGALRDYPGELSPALEPLTTKPVVSVENGPGGLDLRLEAELAELPDDEAAAFREGPSASEALVPRLFEALDLISFFTGGDKEARAWTLGRGRTALDAAAEIHTDMARGFIRCEVVRWNDLVAAGSHAEAARRGVMRLEGKSYEVEDGDVLHIRFSPPR